jgi:peptidoglycan/LPS O-acetylase OafA/YrhL
VTASEQVATRAADPAAGRTTTPSSTVSHAYRAYLDGLRSIAVYLVLLFHTGLGWAKGGFIGVDLFFVLSGFLVTTVLLDEIDRTGRLRVGRFYARRVRRLLPAAVVAVVLTAAAFTVIWTVVRRAEIVDDAQSALLYFANWHFLAETGDYFATDVDKSPYLHFWSLAIEEQFYIVFPVLLVALSRLGRKALLTGLVAMLVLSLDAQLYWAQLSANHAYYGTEARLYQLLAGAVLAVAFQTWAVKIASRSAALVGLVGLVGLLVLGSGLVTVSASWRGIGAVLVSVLLIGGLTVAPGQPISRLLSRPLPVFLGRISYSTYLWHWPVIIALTTLFDTSPWVIAAFAMGISTGLAALSYQVLEMPIRSAKSLDRFRWSTVVVGVGTSAVVAVTLVPTILESDRKPQFSEAYSSATSFSGAGNSPVPQDIDWRKMAVDRGSQHSCSADDPESCIVRRGGGPHVLFVGDSQAMSFVPMFRKLADEHDLTLSLNVASGCPWQEGLANDEQGGGAAEACEEARVGWYDQALPALDPDVVVLLARPRDDEETWGSAVRRRDGKDQPLDQAVYETTQDTLRKVSAVAAKTVVVERMVMPETFSPLNCLETSRRIGDCAVPVSATPSVSDGFYAAAAAESPNIVTVNFNEVFCPDSPVCLPIIDHRVVWRDDHHYSATYVMHVRDKIWRELEDVGAFSG